MRKQRRRVVVTSMVGSVVEFFDFVVFATVAGLVFDELFFPSGNKVLGMMMALSTYAVGFLVRPLGGLLFGHMGDKHGRQRVLVATFVIMASATVLIGVLPTYGTIGVAAPILLVVLRIVQGLGAGGEFGGAVVMVVEHAHDTGKRGFYGSLTTCAVSGGVLLASGTLAVLTAVTSDEQFKAWGWRVPFLLSAVLLLLGLYMRRRIAETPVMKAAVEKGQIVKSPLREVFRRHRRAVLIAVLVPTGMNVSAQVVKVFSVPYVTGESDVSASSLLTLITIGQIFHLAGLVGSGWWSDKVGRRLPMIVGAVGLLIWGFAYFPLLMSGSTALSLLAISVALVFVGFIYGPLATFLSELFGTGVRYTGLSLAYQINIAFAGGCTPAVATALSGATDSWVIVAVMMTVSAALTLGAVIASRDNHKLSLDRET
ncbi:MFS transporter [Streptomyces sp. NPDC002790]|uniref:MFS transporter n=1 Tax=Streptomyces sp. NPDC002790 TaxID=3154431 RepID=UPI0033348411